MTNLKTKKSHFAKSKILLTIICILGLVFSYSCSCRNNSTAPNTPEVNTQTNTNNIIIPSSKLSRQLMVVNSGGTATSKSITITVNNADLDNINFDISSPAGFTKDNFDITDNILTLTGGFGNVDNTEKDVTITLKYNKKADAEKDATLSPSSEEKTFKITQAEKLDATKLTPVVQKASTSLEATGNKECLFNFSKEDGGYYIFSNTDTDDVFDYNAGEVANKIKNRLKKSTAGYFSDVIYNEDVKDAGNNSISFTLTLVLTDKYEMDDNNKITIKVNNVHSNAWIF